MYDSSIAYGLKKALVGEAEKETMKNRQLQLEKENKELSILIEDLEDKIRRTEEVFKEERKKVVDAHMKDREQYKLRIFKLQEQLSTQLERVI